MKKPSLLLLTLLLSLTASAERVTAEQALQQARQFMAGKTFTAAQPLAVHSSRHQAPGKQTQAALYVVNAQGQGYVVVSGDDRTMPILGYSDSGHMDTDNMPEHVKAWLQGYADQIEWLEDHPQAAPAQQSISAPAVSPLLGMTAWNQGDPYNSMCPVDPESSKSARCVTGCVATAMAQVMYYHQWPASTSNEIPSYTTDQVSLEMPAIAAGTPIDWADMLPSYGGTTVTDVQKQAVAQLMLMCGTSVKMDYTSRSSGAVTSFVATALKDYFDYDETTKHLNRLDYKAAPWNQLVYDELAASRPVVYHGRSSGGGHAFVIDGYDQDNYFHVNWGWGGSSNGYFLLSILDPENNSGIGASSSTDGYSFSQGAIVGIQKNIENTDNPVVVTLTSYGTTSLPNGSSFTRSSVSDNFEAAVYFRYWNTNLDATSFDYGVGFFSETGEMLSVAASNTSAVDIYLNYVLNYQPTASFGSGCSSGTYYLKAISRLHGTETWSPNQEADKHAIKVLINGNSAELTAPEDPVVDLAVTIAPELAEPRAYKKCVMNCSITNNGTDFNDELFFLIDGERVGGRVFELDANQSGDLTFTFVPEQAGTVTVAVALYKWNSTTQSWGYNTLGSSQVNISEALPAKLSAVLEVTNAVGNVISGSTAEVKATITNEEAYEYDDDIVIDLLKRIEGEDNWRNAWRKTGSQNRPVVVPAHQTTTVSFSVKGMESGEYLLYTYYKNGANQTFMQSTHFTVKAEEPGDVNSDGQVNGTDLVALADIIMGINGTKEAADINGDKEVNGTDYVALVNIIMNAADKGVIENGEDILTARADEPGTTAIGIAPMSISAGDDGEMTITLDNADMDVTMVQFDMQLPAGLELQRDEEGNAGYTFTDRVSYRSHQLNIREGDSGMHRLLLASQKNATVAGFQGGIITLRLHADESFESGDIVLHHILCASPQQQEARPLTAVLHLGTTTTGVGTIAAQQTTADTIYSMSGQRLTTAKKGVNIVNGKKVVVE